MRYIVYIVALSLVTTLSLFAQQKKYGIKSGIVTEELTMTMGGKPFQNAKIIVYFDDYG